MRIEIAAGLIIRAFFDAKKDADFILDAAIPVVTDMDSAGRAKNLASIFLGGGFRRNDAEPPRCVRCVQRISSS